MELFSIRIQRTFQLVSTFERVKNAISILAKFSEIYAPHIDKANSILSFRVDDENETTEEQQCNSRQ